MEFGDEGKKRVSHKHLGNLPRNSIYACASLGKHRYFVTLSPDSCSKGLKVVDAVLAMDAKAL